MPLTVFERIVVPLGHTQDSEGNALWSDDGNFKSELAYRLCGNPLSLLAREGRK